MTDMRIIGSPDEVDRAYGAVKAAFDVGSVRQYPSRKNRDDVRLYLDVSPKDRLDPTAITLIDPDINVLPIELNDRGGRNHVLVMIDFTTPRTVCASDVFAFNQFIMCAIQKVICVDVDDAIIRMDQSSYDKPELFVVRRHSI